MHSTGSREHYEEGKLKIYGKGLGAGVIYKCEWMIRIQGDRAEALPKKGDIY